jgi:hypothetical protein
MSPADKRAKGGAQEPSVVDEIHMLMDQIGEIEGVAHVVDRALYHEQGKDYDLVRLAVLGIRRLADLAAGRAMLLGQRLDDQTVTS